MNRIYIVLTLLLAYLVLAACSNSRSSSNGGDLGIGAPFTESAPCELIPQPTGEKILPLIVEVAPPAEVQRGESFPIEFAGGYLISNNARVCVDGSIDGYIFANEVPGYDYHRRIQISLGDELLAELECIYECNSQITIPNETTPGEYILSIGTPSKFLSAQFNILVVR